MLKALHTDKGILTGEECSDCASKKWNWYKITSIVVAIKPPDVVQQSLDVVREQSALQRSAIDRCSLEELANLLKGRPTVQLSIRYMTTLGPLILKWVLVVTWSLVMM